MLIRSIPPKGSIPQNIRSTKTIKTYIPRNLTVSKEKISSRGFADKLKWLQEHLQELEQNGASIEIMEEVRSQVEALQELLGVLGRGQ